MTEHVTRQTILVTDGVVLARGGKRFAWLPDLNLTAGQSVAIVGPSGCGKTTALMAMAGIRAPDSGKITIDGTDPWTLGRDYQQNAVDREGDVAPFYEVDIRGFGYEAKKWHDSSIARK